MRLAILATVVALMPAAAWAQEGGPPDAAKELYIAKCASCHTIGAGVRVGPDLKDAHTRRDAGWLATMIKTPSALLGSDPTARAMLAEFNNVRMPDLGLSDKNVEAMVALITLCSTQTCDLKGKLVPVTQATRQDAALGVALFTGSVAQKSGGPACISCHTAKGAGSILAGGTLAKDLTHVFARLGDEGLDAALKNPTFALMNKIYADNPLDKDEVFALRAFLYQSNRGALSEIGIDEGSAFSVPLAGVLGALFALIILNALWSRRLHGVRAQLVAKKEAKS